MSYAVYQKDPVQLSIASTVITPEENDFSEKQITLHSLAAYRRSVRTAPYHVSAFKKQNCSEATRFDMYKVTYVFGVIFPLVKYENNTFFYCFD